MTAAEARRITEVSLTALSGNGGFAHAAIARAAHQGFSNVNLSYQPESGLWDKREFDSLVGEGYRIELFPMEPAIPTVAVISW